MAIVPYQGGSWDWETGAGMMFQYLHDSLTWSTHAVASVSTSEIDHLLYGRS